MTLPHTALLLLPLLVSADLYSDYNYDTDRIDSNIVLDTAAIYEGTFSIENIIIMTVQNLITFVITTVGWGIMPAFFPVARPEAGLRVKRASPLSSLSLPSGEEVSRILHSLGEAASLYSSLP